MSDHICVRCLEEKPHHEFGNNRSTATGRVAACLMCERERDHVRDPLRDKTPHRRQQNLEKGRRRRARMANVYLDDHTAQQMVDHWHEKGIEPSSCIYCGDYADTVDHVIAIALGGPHVLDNLVPACRSCNSSKGSSTIIEWFGKLAAREWEGLADY